MTPAHGLRVGPLLLESDAWQASVDLAVEMEEEMHSETGRSGSTGLKGLKASVARSGKDDNVLVSAVDARGGTIGVLWAQLESLDMRRVPRNLGVLVLRRVYVQQDYQGRHPSVMRLLWECMLGRMTTKRYQDVKVITLQDVCCVRKAGAQWFHLFKQSAEGSLEWTAVPARQGPQSLGDPLPVLKRRPADAIRFKRQRAGVADVNRMLAYPNKAGCNPDNIDLSFDVMVGRHRLCLPARGIRSPQTYWMQPVPSLGMFPFQINESETCRAAMRRFATRLNTNFRAPQNPTDECIGLLADLQLARLNGYRLYDNTLASVHDAFEQERRTAVVRSSDEVRQLLVDIPEVSCILDHCLAALGLPPSYGYRCKMIHILAQDWTSLARFKLHVDNTEGIGLPIGMNTVIIQLTEGHSHMRMWGCFRFEFRGIGAGVVFPGGALHESLPNPDDSVGSEDVIYKLVFFLV